MPRVSIPPSFKRIFDELPEKRRKRVAKALGLFQHDQHYPSLKFERLQGAGGYYSIRASLADRIVLRKLGEDHYEAADVGGGEAVDIVPGSNCCLNKATPDQGPEASAPTTTHRALTPRVRCP